MTYEINEPVAVYFQGYHWPARIIPESECTNQNVLQGREKNHEYLVKFFGDGSYAWHSQASAKKNMKSAYDYSFSKETEEAELVFGLEASLREYHHHMDRHPDLQAKKRAREEASEKAKKRLPAAKRRRLAEEDYVQGSEEEEEGTTKKKKPRKKKKKKKAPPKTKPKKKKKAPPKKKKKKTRKKKLKRKKKSGDTDEESDLELDDEEGMESSSDSDLELTDAKPRFDRDPRNSKDYLAERMKEYVEDDSSDDSSDEDEDDDEDVPDDKAKRKKKKKKMMMPPPPPTSYKMSDRDIQEAKVQIERFVNENRTKDILRWISEISPKTQTFEQFQQFKLPRHLNNLRKKVKDVECQKQFKELLYRWKKLLSQLIQISKLEKEKQERLKIANQGGGEGGETGRPGSQSSNGGGGVVVMAIEECFVSNEGAKFRTGITTRDYGCKMIASSLYKGLGVGREGYTPNIEKPSVMRCMELGSNIESECYSKYHNNTNTRYQLYLRQLKAIHNNAKAVGSELALGIIDGSISPEAAAAMDTKLMASKEKLAERRALREKKLHFRRVADAEKISEGVLICEKCGGNRCSYRELQTRSADESMTLFITCTTCGHKFKKY